MAWRQITAANVQGRFTASEQSMLFTASGSTNKLQERLNDAVKAFVGAMDAAEWDTLADGSVPDDVRNCVMDYAVWEWLKDFPQLDKFKTKERAKAYEDAVSDLSAIRKRTYGTIESPFGTDKTTGNWNCKPKIVGRTDPHPSPYDQLQLTPTPVYANPNAPSEIIPSNSPGIPTPPLDFNLVVTNGQVLAFWNPVVGADSYNVYRSTVSGFTIKGSTPIANVTGTNYADGGVTPGTVYFYLVTSVQGGIESVATAQNSITP